MAKKIIYTKHAEDMIGLRKIKRSSVADCLRDPDKTLKSRKERKIFLKNFGKNNLKVVAIENEEFLVITCHWIAPERIK